jgi:hypothetical protein
MGDKFFPGIGVLTLSIDMAAHGTGDRGSRCGAVLRIAVVLVLLLSAISGIGPILVPPAFAAGAAQGIQAADIDQAFVHEETETLEGKLHRLNRRLEEKQEDWGDPLGRYCRTDAERSPGQIPSGCDPGWQLILVRW